MKISRPAIRRKQPKLMEGTPLHDNATCHKAGRVTSLLMPYDLETFPHSPYYPDMSPSDFDLKLSERQGMRFEDFGSLEADVASQIKRITFAYLATGGNEGMY